MSLRQFGNVIIAHHALHGMLRNVISKRANLHNLSSEILEVLSLGSQVFGVSIGDYGTLVATMNTFHGAFLEWVETPTRCIEQMTPNWALGVETIDDDEFVSEYVIRPCRMMTDSFDNLVSAYMLGLPSTRLFSFYDFIEAVTSTRQFKYRLSDFAFMSPLALMIQGVDDDNYIHNLTQPTPTIPNFTWADESAVYCIARYVNGNIIRLECPTIFSHAHVNSASLSFVNNFSGIHMDASRLPKGKSNLSVSERAVLQYTIGTQCEHAFKMSSRMCINLPDGHGLTANNYIILRIGGKFTVTRCGVTQLVNFTSYSSPSNIGFWNMGFGDLVPTATTIECSSTLHNTLNRAYNEVYARHINMHQSNAHTIYPLSGTIYEPAKLAETLFAAPVAGGTLSSTVRATVAANMVRIMSCMLGLSMYGNSY